MCQEEVFLIFWKLCPRAYPVYNCTVLLYFFCVPRVPYLTHWFLLCRCSPLRLHWRCCLCNSTSSLLSFAVFFFFQIILLYLQLFILCYVVPQAAVDPQRLLQRETTAYAGHLAAQRAPDAQHATSLCGHGIQARATKCVVAEEDSGNMLAPAVALKAHATLTIFNQYHGTTRECVGSVYEWVIQILQGCHQRSISAG